MSNVTAKFPCLIGLLALFAGAACEKKDTAPPEEPAAEAPAEADPEPPAEDDAADDAAKKEEAKAEDKPAAAAKGDVLAVLAANPNTKTFAELIPLSDYGKGLHSTDGAGFTILAPTDEAFAKLPKGTIDRWKKKPEELEGVIRQHVVLGTNDVNKMTGFRTAPTATGKDLEVKVQDTDVSVGGAKLVEIDLMATNGVVHVIDRVIKSK